MVASSFISIYALCEEDCDACNSAVAAEEQPTSVMAEPAGEQKPSGESLAINGEQSSEESSAAKPMTAVAAQSSSTSLNMEGADTAFFALENTSSDEAVSANPQAAELSDAEEVQRSFPVEEQEESVEQAAQKFEIWYIYFDGAQDQSFVEYAFSSDVIHKPAFVPERAGYAFRFWYVVGGKVEPFEFGNAPQGPIVLCAYFAANEDAADMPDAENAVQEELEQETIIPDIRIVITSNANSGLRIGDSVTLYAAVEGAEGLNYSISWIYNDGSGWHMAQENGGASYSFELNEQNHEWHWKMVITVDE